MRQERRVTFRVAMVSALVAAGTAGCDPGSDGERAAPIARAQEVTGRTLATQPTDESLAARPPKVAEMAARPRRDGKGTALLVRFEKDERLGRAVTLRPGKEELTFRDDGQADDEREGDGIFSAGTDIAFESVKLAHENLFRGMELAKEDSTAVFDGRTLLERRGVVREALGGIAFPIGFWFGVMEKKSLLITDPGVVNDPARTHDPCTGTGTPLGKWTFGYLMSEMAGGGDPSAFVERWLQHWLNAQAINGFSVPARPTVQAILDGWPKTPAGSLDLARAPFKLLAIVNRIDLANNPGYAPSGEAEGRFVFQWMEPGTCMANPARPFLVILEYGVPQNSCFGLKDWAQRWRALSFMAVGSPAYNTALEALTEDFAAGGLVPANPNGSAINQIRTNDFKLASPWELREFKLARAFLRLPPWLGGGAIELPAQLKQGTVANTPDDATYNGRTFGPRQVDLRNWVNANAGALLADAASVPTLFPFFPGGGFLGGASPNQLVPGTGDFWDAPGILPFAASPANEVRHHFSLNTCDGCHGGETDTAFTHVKAVASWSEEAPLSAFLTGGFVSDPVTAGLRWMDDLNRRKSALNAFATAHCGPFFDPDRLIELPLKDLVEPIIPFPPIAFQPTAMSH